MFIFFGILPRIHKSHAAEPNGSADPRLGTPAIGRGQKFRGSKNLSQQILMLEILNLARMCIFTLEK